MKCRCAPVGASDRLVSLPPASSPITPAARPVHSPPKPPPKENALSTVAFDTYTAAKHLRDAGFDERQAEAAVSMVRDAVSADRGEIATKADIAEIRADVAEVRNSLALRFEGTSSQLDGLRAALDEHRAATKEDIDALRGRGAGARRRGHGQLLAQRVEARGARRRRRAFPDRRRPATCAARRDAVRDGAHGPLNSTPQGQPSTSQYPHSPPSPRARGARRRRRAFPDRRRPATCAARRVAFRDGAH